MLLLARVLPGSRKLQTHHVAQIVEKIRKLLNCAHLLKVCEFAIWKSAIMNVPAECGQLVKGKPSLQLTVWTTHFHDENHLRARDINGAGRVRELSPDVAYGHVAHYRQEANPWHERTLDISCDSISCGCAQKKGPEAGPKIE
jgi:hypothetical protein